MMRHSKTENDERCRAFISYRHTPVDTAVARDVQRRLEHFHIPREIRRQTGISRIGRIFRDENELPVTSDIDEDIRRVLTEADYLIVICSGHTSESLWVDREIRCFLTGHDRRHVVTVLAEGEPGDVIPEILLEDEDGTPVEPLSCDFRQKPQAGRKVNKKTETARLAAALLSCGLDQLMQRMHQYEMKVLAARMGVGMAVLAVIAGIVIDGSRKLAAKNQALDQSNKNLIRSRSSYLSQASEHELEDGHGVLARLLALEAASGLSDATGLSDAAGLSDVTDLSGAAGADEVKAYSDTFSLQIGGERYPELYRALASSTLAFSNPWTGGDGLQTVRSVSGGSILYARCFEDADRLVTVDELGEVAVTDSMTGEELFRKTYSIGNSWLTSEDIQNYVMPYGEKSVLIRSNGEDSEHFCLTEISLKDGKEERSEIFQGDRWNPSGVLVLPGSGDKKPDLVLARSSWPLSGREENLQLERLDGETWKKKQSLKPEDVPGDKSFLCPAASPDGKWAAFAVKDMDIESFLFWNLDENKVVTVPLPEDEEDSMGRLAVCSLSAGGKFIFSITSVHAGGTAGSLYAVDPDSGEIVWSTDPDDGTGTGSIRSMQTEDPDPENSRSVQAADAKTGQDTAIGQAVYLTAASDYSVWKIRIADGKTESSATFDRKVLSVGESDPDCVDVCLSDGRNILQPWDEGDWILASQAPVGEQADIFAHTSDRPWWVSGSLSRLGDSSYIVVQGKEAGILRLAGDPDYELVSGTGYGSDGLPWDYSVTDCMEADGKLLFAAIPVKTQEGEGLLLCVDPRKNELAWTSRLSFEKSGYLDLSFDGISPDGKTCYVTNGTDQGQRYQVDLKAGSAAEADMERETESSSGTEDGFLEDQEIGVTDSFVQDPGTGATAYWTGNSGLVTVKNSDSGAVTEMESSGFEIAGCIFYGGELLVFTTQNEAIRFDPETGKVLGRFEMLDAPYTPGAPISVHEPGDGTALFEQKASFWDERVFLLVDTDEWKPLRCFSGTIYCEKTRSVYDFGQISEDGAYGIYCYPVWSLRQLVTKAEKLTEEQKLSPQEQARFGLGNLGISSAQ